MQEAVPAHGTPRQDFGDEVPHFTEAGGGGLGNVPGGGGGLVPGGGGTGSSCTGGGGGGGGGNGVKGKPCLQNRGLRPQRSDKQPLSSDQNDIAPPPKNRAASSCEPSSSLVSRHLAQNTSICTTESRVSGPAQTSTHVWRKHGLSVNGRGATDRPSAVVRTHEASAQRKSRISWVHDC